ncbi:Swt1 family HEPN domain-containing protein [Corynebacterium glyciniphilum]|uniref:Swt1 family HEPN domain-containing protein n=1 Tax=Corynebacterium glyciniphilum TaxID=1404244 RepID=UPI0026F0269A|nr:Swt1 family HEPN domain-containing protein [Corynebacterium glyciniphilum]
MCRDRVRSSAPGSDSSPHADRVLPGSSPRQRGGDGCGAPGVLHHRTPQSRNLWAHNAAFNADDTYRALDTMQRLATAIKDKKAAEELAAQRNGVRIIQDRKEDPALSRSAAPQGTPPPPR